MTMYKVCYEILTEPRTDSFLGSGSTSLQNLTMLVEANGPNQACAMVEAMNGGWAHCRTVSAYP